MFDARLFLGLPISSKVTEQLKKVPAAIMQSFVRAQTAEYLQEIESKGVKYLGKFLAIPFDMQQLDAFQAHIISLLKRLLPDFSFDEHSLLLVAYGE